MLYEGIPFLNRKQKETARRFWSNHTGIANDFDNLHRDLMRRYCQTVAKWLVQARDGDIFTLEKCSGKFFILKLDIQ